MPLPAKPGLALARIDLEEKVLDLKLRIRGRLAVDLADYHRAYEQTNDQPIELEQLVPYILQAFIDTDRGFRAWRKAVPVKPEGP